MLTDSVLDKLEILVVNDGSTDGTADIAEKYCALYPETVRLISQKNKGHGGALNTGCSAAQGKYIKVIDADDWVETAFLPQFIQKLEATEADVVLTHHRTIHIQNGEIKNWRSFPKEFDKPYTMDEIMADWTAFERSLAFHGITYRANFYGEYGVSLPENIFYEDHEYATFPCCRAESVVPMDLFVYDYRIGDEKQSVSQKNQLDRIGHSQKVIECMTEAYKKLPDGSGKAYAAAKIQGLLLSYLTTALLVQPDRKTGRLMAKQQMEYCGRETPEIHGSAHKKYQVFCLMNRLHMNKEAFDRLLNSPIYSILKKKRDFN